MINTKLLNSRRLERMLKISSDVIDFEEYKKKNSPKKVNDTSFVNRMAESWADMRTLGPKLLELEKSAKGFSYLSEDGPKLHVIKGSWDDMLLFIDVENWDTFNKPFNVNDLPLELREKALEAKANAPRVLRALEEATALLRSFINRWSVQDGEQVPAVISVQKNLEEKEGKIEVVNRILDNWQ